MNSTQRQQLPFLHGALRNAHMQQFPEFQERAKELDKQSSAIIGDHIRRPYMSSGAGNNEEWQQMPEIPSGKEILHSIPDSELPENPIPNDKDPAPKPWNDKATYLSAQYRLLREDAIRPLKVACQEFMAAPDLGDSHQTSIYTHVYIKGYTFSPAGAAAKIQFSTERAGKRIRWSQSKRLQQGTIVALSPYSGNFRTTCKVAVVAARSLDDVQRDPPQIDIFWSDPEEAEFDPTQRYVMIESKSGYFESSRHMLLAFQKSMFERMPLSEYLINVTAEVGTADFVKNQPLMNLETLQRRPDGLGSCLELPDLTNLDVLAPLPSKADLALDKLQLEAVMRILTKKVAIVQGPPGTGKTFVCVAAILVMLRNWHVGVPPIVVSAQTNHALDQLLNMIAPLDNNILRLGGRAKDEDEVVQSFTLYSRRQQARKYLSGLDQSRQNAMDKLKRLGDVMVADINKMNSQPRNEAELFLGRGLLTETQFDSISNTGWTRSEKDVSDFQLWLKTEQRPAPIAPSLGDRFDEDEDNEYEALDEQEMEARKARDDDDIEALRGRYHEYRRNFVDRYKTNRLLQTQVPAMLARFSDLEDIPDGWRGAVYEYLKQEASKQIRAEFREHMKLYCHIVEDLKVARWEQNVKLVRNLNIKLIGCTTTGISKYRGMIAAIKPRTLLIEEAAETLEGTVLAGMFESLQQLILVGDHEQLQAHCNVSSLAEASYNLAISLFQRLVKNGVKYTMLNTQRRMTPQLSVLLRSVYGGLKDHPSVHGRTDVPGMGGRNSYFFTHNWDESRDESLSRYNVEEAEMVIGFFNFLCLNGVNPKHITVLTFYNGQRKKLLKLLKEKPSLKNGAHLNVYTVDSYQGEENEIILLSLVRSNNACNVGFLENKNRAVVALSRARRGLYIFGNLFTLLDKKGMDSYDLWDSAKDELYNRGELFLDEDGPNVDGGVLPLVCQKHGRETGVTRARDLDDRGGCDEMCNEVMPCGHRCQSKCHWLDHEDMVCKQECTKRIEGCRKGHTCVMMCFQRCECQCPDTELLQRPVPSSRPAIDASAARRMIFHDLGVAMRYPAAHGLTNLQRQPRGSPLAHRPKPITAYGNYQYNQQYSPRAAMPPAPPIFRDSYRQIIASGGSRQLGPANLAHYHAETGLPLTPHAAAVAATLPNSLKTPMPAAHHHPPEPIVEVATRNLSSGQLSHHRHAVNIAAHGRSGLEHPAQLPSQSSFSFQMPQLIHGHTQGPRVPRPNAGYGATLPIQRAPLNAYFGNTPFSAAQNHSISNPKPSPFTAMMRVFVAGLPFIYSEADLQSLFGQYGDLMTPQLWRTHKRAPIGSGTVIMMRADGERAIAALNGMAFDTRILEENQEDPIWLKNFDNRARAFADGMETVFDGTEGGTVMGDNDRRWRPATPMARMRKVPEIEMSPTKSEDLIDFGDDNRYAKEKEDDMMSFTAAPTVRVELKPKFVAEVMSPLDM